MIEKKLGTPLRISMIESWLRDGYWSRYRLTEDISLVSLELRHGKSDSAGVDGIRS
jgi:hypothetical protein